MKSDILQLPLKRVFKVSQFRILNTIVFQTVDAKTENADKVYCLSILPLFPKIKCFIVGYDSVPLV